ncbi:hypothetical protein [Herbaspirillum rubrisubalbicans]|uniref:hypothetical protein n=1 Tax=Herbaspirillum rubrisubalbicans TaxID=80842 RepID=UPI000345D4D8|nr:hypothetical protein [Herbaspirillum rubrisubalbicans]
MIVGKVLVDGAQFWYNEALDIFPIVISQVEVDEARNPPFFDLGAIDGICFYFALLFVLKSIGYKIEEPYNNIF